MLYAILNTEKNRLFYVSEDRKWIRRQFDACIENGDYYKLLTFSDSEVSAVESCSKNGSIIDVRLRSEKPYMADDFFRDRKVIKSLADKKVLVQDAEFWRLNDNGKKLIAELTTEEQ